MDYGHYRRYRYSHRLYPPGNQQRRRDHHDQVRLDAVSRPFLDLCGDCVCQLTAADYRSPFFKAGSENVLSGYHGFRIRDYRDLRGLSHRPRQSAVL